MLTDTQVMSIRRCNDENSNLICPFCQSDKTTSMGQYRRINDVFATWWRCNACHKRYGLTLTW